MMQTNLITDRGADCPAALFIVFNRPDVTAKVFAAIREARPARLYVSADGPRSDRPGEELRCNEVRQIATNVDWPCEVKTLFRDTNLGCKMAVSSGIDWFFSHEERGIILEDDCLPHPDFFHFCGELLDFYADDDRIFVITGNNFQDGRRRGQGSYYFSKYNHCWGWATWRRAWNSYRGDMPFWRSWGTSSDWAGLTSDKVERRYWKRIFDRAYAGLIDSWAYPWTACVWHKKGLTVTPNVNLVSNIGFGPDSTHTAEINSPLAEIATGAIGEIIHPSHVSQDIEADRYVFDYAFGGRLCRFPYVIYSLPKRAIGKIYRLIKSKVVHA